MKKAGNGINPTENRIEACDKCPRRFVCWTRQDVKAQVLVGVFQGIIDDVSVTFDEDEAQRIKDFYDCEYYIEKDKNGEPLEDNENEVRWFEVEVK